MGKNIPHPLCSHPFFCSFQNRAEEWKLKFNGLISLSLCFRSKQWGKSLTVLNNLITRLQFLYATEKDAKIAIWGFVSRFSSVWNFLFLLVIHFWENIVFIGLNPNWFIKLPGKTENRVPITSAPKNIRSKRHAMVTIEYFFAYFRAYHKWHAFQSGWPVNNNV